MKEISFNQIMPTVLYVFQGGVNKSNIDSQADKTAVSYRMMYCIGEPFLWECNGRIQECHTNDIIYLPQGTKYSTIPCSEQMSLSVINVFFTFLPFDGYEQRQSSLYYKRFEFLMDPSQVDCDMEVKFTDVHFFDYPQLIKSATDHATFFKTVLHSFQMQKKFWLPEVNGMLVSFLSHLVKSMDMPDQREVSNSKKILDYIQTHYTERLRCSDVAEIFHYHPNYVSRLIKAATGCSFQHYVTQIKLRHAAEQLEQGYMPSQVAESLSFYDGSHLMRMLKKHIKQ